MNLLMETFSGGGRVVMEILRHTHLNKMWQLADNSTIRNHALSVNVMNYAQKPCGDISLLFIFFVYMISMPYKIRMPLKLHQLSFFNIISPYMSVFKSKS